MATSKMAASKPSAKTAKTSKTSKAAKTTKPAAKTKTSTKSQQAKPQAKKGLSTGAIVAIVLGSVIGGLAIIVGIPLAILFTSTPAVQRTARDAIRQNNASKIATEIVNYQANNRGKTPTNWAEFTKKYVSDLTDPDGVIANIKGCDYNSGNCKDIKTLDYDTDKYTFFVTTHARCQDSDTIVSGTSRQVAIYFAKESGGAYCLTN